jgi:hypothetical protein
MISLGLTCDQVKINFPVGQSIIVHVEVGIADGFPIDKISEHHRGTSHPLKAFVTLAIKTA